MNRMTMVIGVLLLGACAPQPDINQVKGVIDEYNRVLAEAMVAGDNETIMSYYDEGAYSMPSNTPMLKGKAAIASYLEQMDKAGVKITAAKFTAVDVNAGGNLAYEIGKYEMSFDVPTVGTLDDRGKYVSVWKKQTDGSWKVYAEIWNTDLEAPSGQ